ncbi:MAG: TolC family protein [Coleofasciculus sp. Co-bin14]|nr:TolC family protein [Coleofasciculus sp. Co-bin14]
MSSLGVLAAVPSNTPVLAPPQTAELVVQKEAHSKPVDTVASATVKTQEDVNHQARSQTTTESVTSLPSFGKNEDSVLVAVGNRLLGKGETPIAASQEPTDRVNAGNPDLSVSAAGSSKAQQPETEISALIVDAYQNQPTIATPFNILKPAQEATYQPVLSQVAFNNLTSPTSLAAYARLQAAREFERNLVFPPLDASVVQAVASATPQPALVAQNAPPPEYLNPSPNPLLFPTQSQEVQVQTLQPVTLQQALELARRNNRDLQQAQLNLERSRYGLQAALAAEFPTASVTADFNRSESAQGQISQTRQGTNQQQPLQPLQPPLDVLNPLINRLNTTGTQDGGSASTSFSTGLQLSYDLYTSGRRPAQIRAAEQQVRFQELDVERLTEQLRLDVNNIYYNLQQTEAQVEIARAAVADATQSLRDAVLREQAGLGTRFDVLQAQVSLSNANQDLTRALSQLQIRRRQLTQLLNLSQTVEVSAADPIGVAGQWSLSLEQSIVLALKNRAELEQQLIQPDINEQQQTIALAATRPQVSLTAGYNIVGVLNDNVGPRGGLSLGAGLRWNFFDAGEARARANQARTDIAIAENTFAEQRSQIRLAIEQAFFDLNSSAQNIQTATFALGQAQESLRLARLRFQAGVGTQTDVINQQTELTRARGNRITAILDYNRALASLQRAVSNLPDSNLFDLP